MKAMFFLIALMTISSVNAKSPTKKDWGNAYDFVGAYNLVSTKGESAKYNCPKELRVSLNQSYLATNAMASFKISDLGCHKVKVEDIDLTRRKYCTFLSRKSVRETRSSHTIVGYIKDAETLKFTDNEKNTLVFSKSSLAIPAGALIPNDDFSCQYSRK